MADWTGRWLSIAESFATFSKDPSTKVGCVIVDDEQRVRSVGWNGFPRGVDDKESRLTNREIKLLLTVHAEANAVASAARQGVPLAGCTAYVTHPCRSGCMGLLAQAGITKVVHVGRPLRAGWEMSQDAAAKIATEARVKVGRVRILKSGIGAVASHE